LDEWLLPVFYFVCTRRTMSVRELSEFLGVPSARAKSLLWYFRKKTVDAASACNEIAWASFIVVKRGSIVLLGKGRLVLVRVRRKRLVRGYSIPSSLACAVLRVLIDKGLSARECHRDRKCLAELANSLAVHRKTVSIILRVLTLLECPGTVCPLENLCRKE